MVKLSLIANFTRYSYEKRFVLHFVYCEPAQQYILKETTKDIDNTLMTKDIIEVDGFENYSIVN